ncbi:MAG: hypothetical protein CK531_09045 [Gemmatimonadetes bacterium]|nr:MAG: hypothetical protein CK531_09045 [Gemmatimonadota bacterium]
MAGAADVPGGVGISVNSVDWRDTLAARSMCTGPGGDSMASVSARVNSSSARAASIETLPLVTGANRAAWSSF